MGYCKTERQDLKDYHNFQKCFISNGELYPLCKDRRRYERYESENADKVDQIF